MRTFALTAALLLAPVAAFSQPATEATIHKLLLITKVDRMTDAFYSQLKPSMESMITQSAPPDQREKALSTFRTKYPQMEKVLREELSFKSMEKDYVQIYQKSFTEEELTGILAFYDTPAGQAMVNKMPMVMQQSMMVAQTRMPNVMRRLREIMDKK